MKINIRKVDGESSELTLHLKWKDSLSEDKKKMLWQGIAGALMATCDESEVGEFLTQLKLAAAA